MAKDLFSGHADSYAAHRPRYPDQLFQFILQHVAGRDRVWDCATGSGQAASELVKYFDKVEATDISANQIKHAFKHPNINYRVCAAEETVFPDNHFDLITVAQAYHWFNFEPFIQEVNRTGKNGSNIAIWGYGVITTDHQKVNLLVNDFYTSVVGPYWNAERKYVEDNYTSIPFPFHRIPAPEFAIDIEYNLDQLLAYLHTWSAVQGYIKQQNKNPIEDFRVQLTEVWGESQSLFFRFPLFLLLGIIQKNV